MSDLLALVDRVEKEAAGSRELDAEIWLTVTPGATREPRTVRSSKGLWPDYVIDETRDASERLIVVPSYTSSIDAAMSLVPEGWGLKLEHNMGHGTTCTVGHVGPDKLYDRPEGWSGAATPALALCAAALRALANTGSAT